MARPYRVSTLTAFCLLSALVLQAATEAAMGAEGRRSFAVESAVYNLCRQGDNLMNAQAYASARDTLKQAAAYDPTSYSAYVHESLSDCYRQLKDYPNAIKEGQAALKFDAANTGALHSLALAYQEMDHFDTAIHYLKQLQQLSSDAAWGSRAQQMIGEFDAYGNLTRAMKEIKAGRFTSALRLLERAAARDPTPSSAAVHSNLAFVLERSGNPERAIVEGKKALSLDPADKYAVYTVGIAYQDSGQFDESIAWLRRYLEMETSPAERQAAAQFIQELADDRSKASASTSADYLDEMREDSRLSRWPARRLPLKVYVSPGQAVRGYRAPFNKFIAHALDAWCEASGRKLDYRIVPDRASADIKVEWTAKPIKLLENGRDRVKAGLTTLSTTDSGDIDSALISVCTINPFEPRLDVEEGECAMICMHEVGHALGLNHSGAVTDVMYFGSSSKQPGKPSGRDRATLARLYSSYPAIAFKAKSKPAAEPIKFLPPPAFVPPRPAGADKVQPPLFLPPPIEREKEKLRPPLFTPPPLAAPQAAGENRLKEHAGRAPDSKAPAGAGGPPFFLPPPARD